MHLIASVKSLSPSSASRNVIKRLATKIPGFYSVVHKTNVSTQSKRPRQRHIVMTSFATPTYVRKRLIYTYIHALQESGARRSPHVHLTSPDLTNNKHSFSSLIFF